MELESTTVASSSIAPQHPAPPSIAAPGSVAPPSIAPSQSASLAPPSITTSHNGYQHDNNLTQTAPPSSDARMSQSFRALQDLLNEDDQASFQQWAAFRQNPTQTHFPANATISTSLNTDECSVATDHHNINKEDEEIVERKAQRRNTNYQNAIRSSPGHTNSLTKPKSPSQQQPLSHASPTNKTDKNNNPDSSHIQQQLLLLQQQQQQQQAYSAGRKGPRPDANENNNTFSKSQIRRNLPLPQEPIPSARLSAQPERNANHCLKEQDQSLSTPSRSGKQIPQTENSQKHSERPQQSQQQPKPKQPSPCLLDHGSFHRRRQALIKQQNSAHQVLLESQQRLRRPDNNNSSTLAEDLEEPSCMNLSHIPSLENTKGPSIVQSTIIDAERQSLQRYRKEVLVRYLQVMGAAPEMAEEIAKRFEQVGDTSGGDDWSITTCETMRAQERRDLELLEYQLYLQEQRQLQYQQRRVQQQHQQQQQPYPSEWWQQFASDLALQQNPPALQQQADDDVLLMKKLYAASSGNAPPRNEDALIAMAMQGQQQQQYAQDFLVAKKLDGVASPLHGTQLPPLQSEPAAVAVRMLNPAEESSVAPASIINDLSLRQEPTQTHPFLPNHHENVSSSREGALENQQIIYGQPIQMSSLLKERWVRYVIVLVAMTIVASIGLAVFSALYFTRPPTQLSQGATGITPNDPIFYTFAPTHVPSLAPTRIDASFYEMAQSISGSQAVENREGPQFAALGWLSSVDQVGVAPDHSLWPQRYAMVVLFFATGGPDHWLPTHGWMNPMRHECDWGFKIFCETTSTDDRILKYLDLTGLGLSGSLPDEISLLTELSSLRVSNNELYGSLPSSLFQMKHLDYIEAKSNFFSGTLPSTLGDAHELTHLDFSDNRLTGVLPTELYDMSALRFLYLSGNGLTGKIAGELVGQLYRLSRFDLRRNYISGTVPREFDELTVLDFLLLDYNRLTGRLPTWTARWATRQEISISYNFLTGTIPFHFVNGSKSLESRLRKINLSNNQLTGTVADLISTIPSLWELDLSSNQLRGTFPDLLDNNWPQIEKISMANNKLSGTIPSNMKSKGLESIDFSANKMTGEIPKKLVQYPGLALISLGSNDLSGSVPSEFAEMTSLRKLKLNGCKLNGTLPTLNERLEILHAANNDLTGTLPSGLGTMASLREIDLHSNLLTGKIPSELGKLSFLNKLSLDNNILVGTVPASIGSLLKLKTITISGNRLDGSVPKALCDLLQPIPHEDIGCELECSCCSDKVQSCGDHL